METAIAARSIPDYDLGVDCLTSLYDATAKLTSTAARGKQFSKHDHMEASGLVMMTLFVARAACVDLTGAYDARVEGTEVDPRRADRALICLNERLVKLISLLMLSRTKKTVEVRTVVVREVFERFAVRELYALAMVFVAALGIKVEV